jgi:hypothetical protein
MDDNGEDEVTTGKAEADWLAAVTARTKAKIMKLASAVRISDQVLYFHH